MLVWVIGYLDKLCRYVWSLEQLARVRQLWFEKLYWCYR